LPADLLSRIRERGPLTAAAFMDLVLYDPGFGYYTRTPYPSSASSVTADGIRLSGELLAHRLVSFAHILNPAGSPFTVVDAGAGDGYFAHALLRGLRQLDPALCAATHLHLIERSASARHAQRATLAAWTDQAIPGGSLPDEFDGVVIARRLLSAMPAHLVTMRDGELRESYVDARDGRLTPVDGALSSPSLAAHLRDSRDVVCDAAQIAVSPSALEWVGDTARRLRRGFILVIDDDCRAARQQEDECPIRCEVAADDGTPVRTPWLDAPAQRPLAAAIDFAAVQRVAGREGCVTARFADQATFLVGVAGHRASGFTDDERRAFAALTRAAGGGSLTRVLLLVKNVDAKNVDAAGTVS
jgi:SAM-dependent MidA family methyltransferase